MYALSAIADLSEHKSRSSLEAWFIESVSRAKVEEERDRGAVRVKTIYAWSRRVD